MISIKQVSKPIIVRYNQTQMTLTTQEKAAIQTNWNIINKDSIFFNGEIYSLVDTEETDDEILFVMNKTDFSHYMYSDKHDMGKNRCRIVYTDSILITSDNKLILGVMNTTTASPNLIQCVGGNIDDNDLVGNEFDLKASIIREVEEEIGLHLTKEEHTTTLIKTDSDLKYTGVMFYVRLSESANNIRKIFNAHTTKIKKQGLIPELQDIILLDLKPSTIEVFQQMNRGNFVDYMDTLLGYLQNERIH